MTTTTFIPWWKLKMLWKETVFPRCKGTDSPWNRKPFFFLLWRLIFFSPASVYYFHRCRWSHVFAVLLATGMNRWMYMASLVFAACQLAPLLWSSCLRGVNRLSGTVTANGFPLAHDTICTFAIVTRVRTTYALTAGTGARLNARHKNDIQLAVTLLCGYGSTPATCQTMKSSRIDCFATDCLVRKPCIHSVCVITSRRTYRRTYLLTWHNVSLYT